MQVSVVNAELSVYIEWAEFDKGVRCQRLIIILLAQKMFLTLPCGFKP